jgi:hypothetical protein
MVRKPPFYYVNAILLARQHRAVHHEALIDAAGGRELNWTKFRLFAKQLYKLTVVPVLGAPGWLTAHPSEDEMRYWKLRSLGRRMSEADNQAQVLASTPLETLADNDVGRSRRTLLEATADGEPDLSQVRALIAEAEAIGEFTVDLEQAA